MMAFELPRSVDIARSRPDTDRRSAEAGTDPGFAQWSFPMKRHVGQLV
jgi:hypothetical protein